MRRLVLYSYNALSTIASLYIISAWRTLQFPLWLSILIIFIPWLVFLILASRKITSDLSVLILLETFSVISAIVLLEAYLFSAFLIVIFILLLRINHEIKGSLFIMCILVVLTFLYVVLGLEVKKLLPCIPVSLISFLFVNASRESEAEMRAEIDAQQTQINGKNKLLSTLSHELRTPLSVIKTSTEIILEERPGKINSTQKKLLSSTLDNTMRMVRLVDTILASIKVEYAWLRMKKGPLDLRPVIRKVCTDMQPFISSRNQELKYTYPNLLSKVIADENWIQQVLINLIHNASKHIGKDGRIIISVTENESCVVISVSDDGSGIENREKPKIFSEFYQGGQTEESNLDGVGLGLSIVKNVIEKHNGKVYVGSVAGLGTTLSFTLPKEEDR